MIKNFKCKHTQALYDGGNPKQFRAFKAQVERCKLQMLDNAVELLDLRSPPGGVVRQKRAVSVDTALRLARYFNTIAQFWLNLQTSYDLKMAQQSITTIENEILPLQVA
jgi:addiction module HigA family antidote